MFLFFSTLLCGFSSPIKRIISNARAFLKETKLLMKQYDSIANSSEAKNEIDELESSITELADNTFGVRVKTHVFGSRLTGLAHRKSDVDIYLEKGE
jgi:DNA polymerase sigma